MTELAGEGVPVKHSCLALGVSRSGCYDARSRQPSARVIKHAWLTDLIGTAHQASRQTYGPPRVHAELAPSGPDDRPIRPSHCPDSDFRLPNSRNGPSPSVVRTAAKP